MPFTKSHIKTRFKSSFIACSLASAPDKVKPSEYHLAEGSTPFRGCIKVTVPPGRGSVSGEYLLRRYVTVAAFDALPPMPSRVSAPRSPLLRLQCAPS